MSVVMQDCESMFAGGCRDQVVGGWFGVPLAAARRRRPDAG